MRFILCIAALALSGAASAADMPVKASPATVVSHSWTGFHVGANVGYAWDHSRARERAGDEASGVLVGGVPAIGPASTSLHNGGWAGGVQAGYSLQFDPRWVAGVEADFQWSNIKGNGSATANLVNDPFGAFSANEEIKWFGTVRARLGYLPANNLLVYATGGLAYGRVNQSANFGLTTSNVLVVANGVSFTCSTPGFTFGFGEGPTCFAGSKSSTAVGWTVGAGAEYRFAQNLSLKLEYLYVSLGSDFSIPAVTVVPGSAPSVLDVKFDTAFSLVRTGINYRF